MITAADALVILLVVLTVGPGLGPAGWLAGVAFGVVGWAVLADGLRRSGEESFGPADRITLARAVLVGGVTALVVDTTDPKPDPVTAIAVLAATALAVHLADILTARRAGTTFGMRFAMEVDAFFVLVLSAYVATSLGGWVLAIGWMHLSLIHI